MTARNPSQVNARSLLTLIRQLRRKYPAMPLAQRVVPGILGHADVAQQGADQSQNHTDAGPYSPGRGSSASSAAQPSPEPVDRPWNRKESASGSRVARR